MTKKRSKFLALFTAALFFTCYTQAQESVNASGGDVTGSGGSVSYSIGQVVYTTDSASAGTIAKGVQHAYEIYTVGINETAPKVSLKLYPNPTTDVLTMLTDGQSKKNLSYTIFDTSGNILMSGQAAGPQTQINMNGFASAIYFLNVTDNENKNIQSFKIIKN